MEILIGTSFVFAFVLLGTLISLGNERQRRAIDGLREQTEAWAEQDIRIKREKLARQISVTEPLAWLEKTAALTLGTAPKLVMTSLWQQNNQTALIAICQDGRRLVFTPSPRERFLKALQGRKSGILARVETGPLGDRPGKVSSYVLSLVNCGMFFDIEAAQVWGSMTGENTPLSRLTMFEVPQPKGNKPS
jgi:hypothetical protein